LYTSEGRFTFTSHTPGEHLICLYSNSTGWFAGGQLRVHLDIQVGEHAMNYEEVRVKKLKIDFGAKNRFFNLKFLSTNLKIRFFRSLQKIS
jgi:hypothetical protein